MTRLRSREWHSVAAPALSAPGQDSTVHISGTAPRISINV